ncbi:MAG TPA: hypothetical protein VE754_01930 [Actinomycetota bacterium]|nr:hypothetical protein [Actinomycetota bacterium]
MPRRHRSARERGRPEPPRPPRGQAPPGAQRRGFTVRQVEGERAYTCPGCNGPIAAGTTHIVAFEDEQPDLRRHWHTPCWLQEIRRFG